MSVRQIALHDVTLEAVDWGQGEPVVFVQTALTADELRPLAEDRALDSGYRKVLYHRRGYAGSSPARGRGSIVRDGRDCRALLAAMGLDRAHLVGYSYSAAVAMQVAADAPGATHSLTLLEPPPVHTSSASSFRAANDRLLRTRHERGTAVALEEFLSMLIGVRWREVVEERVPGSAAQMERDTGTFFDVDLPALLEWQFTPADARRIRCPVLLVSGTDSGPLFADVRNLVLSWLPHAEDVRVEGADHALVLTHAPQIAAALVAFLRRHPL